MYTNYAVNRLAVHIIVVFCWCVCAWAHSIWYNLYIGIRNRYVRHNVGDFRNSRSNVINWHCYRNVVCKFAFIWLVGLQFSIINMDCLGVTMWVRMYRYVDPNTISRVIGHILNIITNKQQASGAYCWLVPANKLDA